MEVGGTGNDKILLAESMQQSGAGTDHREGERGSEPQRSCCTKRQANQEPRESAQRTCYHGEYQRLDNVKQLKQYILYTCDEISMLGAVKYTKKSESC